MSRFGLDLSDLLALVGFAAMEYGLWQVSEPAAWTVGGVCVLALALWPVRRRKDPV